MPNRKQETLQDFKTPSSLLMAASHLPFQSDRILEALACHKRLFYKFQLLCYLALLFKIITIIEQTYKIN